MYYSILLYITRSAIGESPQAKPSFLLALTFLLAFNAQPVSKGSISQEDGPLPFKRKSLDHWREDRKHLTPGAVAQAQEGKTKYEHNYKKTGKSVS